MLREIIITVFGVFLLSECSADELDTIDIYAANPIGKVNRLILGNNLLGYERDSDPNYNGYTDFGAGVWDPKWGRPVDEAVSLAKQCGVSALRFPGGCGTHLYNWKATVGKDRRDFLFGIDDFLGVCYTMQAKPVLTVSYFTGNEDDAADLVEYLNVAVEQSSPAVGRGWANQRVLNGRYEPYAVKYFEIGNEDWHGDHLNVHKVEPEEYAQRYLLYYDAMKKVDPGISIGLILSTPDWNKRVARIVKDKVDFGILHVYPNAGYRDKELVSVEPGIIFQKAWTIALVRSPVELRNAAADVGKYAKKNVPLAITEYNGGFVQEAPVPYRHSLGTALLNAELLMMFLHPENGVLMAHYWNYVNEYWGMIANSFDGIYSDLKRPFYKRPNYYVHYLFNRFLGDTLVSSAVSGRSYVFKDARFYFDDILDSVPVVNDCSVSRSSVCRQRDNDLLHVRYLSVVGSISEDKNKLYLLVVNKELVNGISARIKLHDFSPAVLGNCWVLNGPAVDAINERNHDSVKVAPVSFRVNGASFEFTFEPHSLTAIELTRADAN